VIVEQAGRAPDAFAPAAGNPRFPLVDAMRALAALLVVGVHAQQLTAARGGLATVVRHFDLGVVLFFAITGFLLYRPYLSAAAGRAPLMPARTFYVRRILRVVPAYWVALTLLAIWPGIALAGYGVVNQLFLQVYRTDWARTGIGPAWTICVELTFYLLLPVLAAVTRRAWGGRPEAQRRRCDLALLAGLFFVSVAYREIIDLTGVWNPVVNDILPGTVGWFAVGMALAVVSVAEAGWPVRLRSWVARHGALTWLAAVVVYAVSLLSAETIHGGPVVFVLFAACAGLLLAPAVLGAVDTRIGRALRWSPAVWLGLVSYGIYLYHFDLMIVIHQRIGLTGASGIVVLSLLGAVAATVCAAASYYVVERPFLRLKRR
jgi:peptidoglycan/LPS O-acetylase OafA/YrhL